MRDPRCGREVVIRAGMTAIIAAVLFIFLKASAWVWLAPPGVALLVLIKWQFRPRDGSREGEADENL